MGGVQKRNPGDWRQAAHGPEFVKCAFFLSLQLRDLYDVMLTMCLFKMTLVQLLSAAAASAFAASLMLGMDLPAGGLSDPLIQLQVLSDANNGVAEASGDEITAALTAISFRHLLPPPFPSARAHLCGIHYAKH